MTESIGTSTDRAYYWRWWAALAGLIAGFFDAFAMSALGIEFALNGHDVWLVVGAYFGISFAVLGYLSAVIAAGRRRDRQAATIIQQQMKDLQEMRSRLAQSEKLAALGQLAAVIAHEVRNPLAVMRSASQNIAESVGEQADDAQKSCSFIVAEIDRLTNVVSSLLTFARPLSLHRKRSRIGDLLDRTVQLAQGEVAAKGVRVQQVATESAEIDVDPDLLCQALLGLLTNAVESAGPGGEVSIRAERNAEQIEVAVEDSGPGVPAELRERIFEPFFTTRKRGTGLGLAVVRQIVQAHGGVVHVASRVGGGARFAVRLPLQGQA